MTHRHNPAQSTSRRQLPLIRGAAGKAAVSKCLWWLLFRNSASQQSYSRVTQRQREQFAQFHTWLNLDRQESQCSFLPSAFHATAPRKGLNKGWHHQDSTHPHRPPSPPKKDKGRNPTNPDLPPRQAYVPTPCDLQPFVSRCPLCIRQISLSDGVTVCGIATAEASVSKTHQGQCTLPLGHITHSPEILPPFPGLSAMLPTRVPTFLTIPHPVPPRLAVEGDLWLRTFYFGCTSVCA